MNCPSYNVCCVFGSKVNCFTAHSCDGPLWKNCLSGGLIVAGLKKCEDQLGAQFANLIPLSPRT